MLLKKVGKVDQTRKSYSFNNPLEIGSYEEVRREFYNFFQETRQSNGPYEGFRKRKQCNINKFNLCTL